MDFQAVTAQVEFTQVGEVVASGGNGRYYFLRVGGSVTKFTNRPLY